MRRTIPRLPALTLALCGLLAGAATAQTPPADTAGTPREQQSTGGISYLSGGAGSEERQAMEARQKEFPLKLVLSAGSGEFIVAESVRLMTPQGPVLVVRDAGPVLMIRAPQGAYTVEAVYQGRTQRTPARIGSGPSSVQLRFPG